ncbi:MAG: hypothetical protein OEM91_09800 [Hyphomicrobiales bacterium]|nr:hypothetical protein [Hyphomicrobiales bacterium]
MRFVLACLLTAAFGLTVLPDVARADPLVGNWGGGGTIKLTNGALEKVSCRVRYEDGGGKTFVLNATCATTAGTIKQSGRVVKRSGSRYTGRLYSEEYSVSGDVSVSVKGGSQTVRVSSPKGSGNLSLRRR